MSDLQQYQLLEQTCSTLQETWFPEKMTQSLALNTEKFPQLYKKASQITPKNHPALIKKTIDTQNNSLSFEGMCAIHWGKKSAYKIKKNKENVEVCRKCAVQFASKGIKVESLDQSPQNQAESLTESVQVKMVQGYVRKMQIDSLLIKLRMAEMNYQQKNSHLKRIIETHQRLNEQVECFYSVLRQQLLKIWNESEFQSKKHQQKHNLWKVRTSDSVIALEKVLKDINKRILELPFETAKESDSLYSCRFYKDALIFHAYESKQLDSETQQVSSLEKLTPIEAVVRFFDSASETVKIRIEEELKNRKSLD